jgi:multidrug efflux pump subunit AcrA (membrane-fusion protein)
MANDLDKFLEDSKTYGDNTPVRIGDTEVPLGSLRQLNAAERQRLADAVKQNEARQQELTKEREQVMNMAGKAQQAYQTAQETIAKAQAAIPAPQPSNNPFDDAWLQPVDKRLSPLEKEVAELKKLMQEGFKQRDTQFNNIATVWSEDRWDGQYRGLGPDFQKREKKPTKEEIVKYATENRIYDRWGIPDVRAAWEKMNEADRLEELRKSEYERGRLAGRQEHLAARVPPPGVPGAGAPPGPVGRPNPGELGDLYSEAIKDPELRAMIEALPGTGMN